MVCEKEALRPEVTVNERKVAKEEAMASREELVLWADGSHNEEGPCGDPFDRNFSSHLGVAKSVPTL